MSRPQLLLYVAVTASTVLVGVLTMKVRALRADARATFDALTLPQRGAYVPTFEAVNLHGASTLIGETTAGGRQVLLLFTTTCPHCLRSPPVWKELVSFADTFSAFPVHVVGVAHDSLPVARTYAEEHGLRFDIVNFPVRKLAHLYRARTVPQTLVLTDEGRILYARTGVVERTDLDSIIGTISR